MAVRNIHRRKWTETELGSNKKQYFLVVLLSIPKNIEPMTLYLLVKWMKGCAKQCKILHFCFDISVTVKDPFTMSRDE